MRPNPYRRPHPRAASRRTASNVNMSSVGAHFANAKRELYEAKMACLIAEPFTNESLRMADSVKELIDDLEDALTHLFDIHLGRR